MIKPNPGVKKQSRWTTTVVGQIRSRNDFRNLYYIFEIFFTESFKGSLDLKHCICKYIFVVGSCIAEAIDQITLTNQLPVLFVLIPECRSRVFF